MAPSESSASGSPLTAKLKLVTIIAPSGMQGTLVNLLMALGASGYTTTKAEGFGRHGASRFGLIEGGNVRIEVLGDATRAGAILAQVSARFAESRVVAFASEVEAVPAQHFE